MNITLNGKPTEVPDGISAQGLLEHLGLEPKGVVVEVNLDIVKRDRLSDRFLGTGDTVEILQFVGGG